MRIRQCAQLRVLGDGFAVAGGEAMAGWADRQIGVAGSGWREAGEQAGGRVSLDGRGLAMRVSGGGGRRGLLAASGARWMWLAEEKALVVVEVVVVRRASLGGDCVSWWMRGSAGGATALSQPDSRACSKLGARGRQTRAARRHAARHTPS